LKGAGHRAWQLLCANTANNKLETYGLLLGLV